MVDKNVLLGLSTAAFLLCAHEAERRGKLSGLVL